MLDDVPEVGAHAARGTPPDEPVLRGPDGPDVAVAAPWAVPFGADDHEALVRADDILQRGVAVERPPSRSRIRGGTARCQLRPSTECQAAAPAGDVPTATMPRGPAATAVIREAP